MTLISIIIPTKNRPNLLSHSVNSVINQSYKNWELYIVNDSNKKIIINQIDPRIHLVNNKFTSGANGARNTGINLSSGKYISFLDDDDTWKKDKLEKQFKLMEGSDAILSYTGKRIVYKTRKGIKEKSSYKKTFCSSNITLQFHNYIGTTSSIMIRSNIFDKHNVKFDEKIQILQDYDLYLQLCNLGKFIGISENLITYNIDNRFDHISLRKNIFFKSAYLIFNKQRGFYKISILIGLTIILFQKLYKLLK
jgi:glycosyltransferase involved in cell wall biosynthesis